MEKGNDSIWKEVNQKRKDKEEEKKKRRRIRGERAHEYLQDWERKEREAEEEGAGAE